jgi:hypothetical protein
MANNGGAGAAEPVGAVTEAGAALAPAASLERQVSQLGAALSGEAGSRPDVKSSLNLGLELCGAQSCQGAHLLLLPTCHRPLPRGAPSLPVPLAGETVPEAAVEEAKPAGGSQKDLDVEGLGEGDWAA